MSINTDKRGDIHIPLLDCKVTMENSNITQDLTETILPIEQEEDNESEGNFDEAEDLEEKNIIRAIFKVYIF